MFFILFTARIDLLQLANFDLTPIWSSKMKFYLFFFLSYGFSEKNENLLSFSSADFGTAQKFIHHLAKSLLENQPQLKSGENLESSYISSQSFIDNIFDYGCWCQMSEELLKYRRGPGTVTTTVIV